MSQTKLFNGILPVFFLANIADLIMTLNLRRLGALVELNPVADVILQRFGGAGLIAFKIGVIGSAGFLLWFASRKSPRFTLMALILVTLASLSVVMVGVMCMWEIYG